jgi:hypothetical protein
MRMEGVEPPWVAPPVSETGASAGFRHIRVPGAAPRLRWAGTRHPRLGGSVDEERVAIPVRFVREGSLLERRREAVHELADLREHVVGRALAEPNGQHARARRLRHRRRHPARFQQLAPLVAEPNCVRRVLRVEAVRLDKLWPVEALLAT